MDTQNYNNVIEMAQTQEDREKVKFILNELYPRQNRAVPDPYYGGEQGFEKVYQLLDEATDAFLSNIKEQ
jgi:protein-tyrosine phosphatase